MDEKVEPRTIAGRRMMREHTSGSPHMVRHVRDVEDEAVMRDSASVELRMRRFIENGFRPELKSHLLPGEPREGWATLYWREWISGKDREPVFLSEPRGDSVGWSVDAVSVIPKEQRVVGGVFRTVSEALAYAETEMDRVVGMRS